MLKIIQTTSHFIFLLVLFLGPAGKFSSTLSAQPIRSSAQKEIKLFDPTGAGNGNITLSASGGTQSYTLRFPIAPPAANQLLGVSSISAGVASLAWSNAASISGNGSNGQLAFWTGFNSQSGSSHLFWDDAAKRLGIGTSNPQQKLAINEPTNSDLEVSMHARGGNKLRSQLSFGVRDNNSNMVGGSIGSDGNKGGGLILNGNTNDISSGTPHILVESDGEIFLNGGTDKGDYKLQINGDLVSVSARFTNVSSGGYNSSLNLKSDGTLIKSSSDVRLKKNIETISNPIEKVLSLRGVTYNWIDSATPKRMMGMIAQEVLSVVPELVFQNESDGFFGINYGETAGLLIEAIKAQQLTIQELKKSLSVQQEEINSLKKKIVSLQPKL
jgi:hypothetical protein